jgi:hypothetical protein
MDRLRTFAETASASQYRSLNPKLDQVPTAWQPWKTFSQCELREFPQFQSRGLKIEPTSNRPKTGAVERQRRFAFTFDAATR